MNALVQFEGSILLWIQENLRGFLDAPMRIITTLGNTGIFWIVLTVLLLIFKKTRKPALNAALSMILALLAVNIIIKPLVGRIRPYEVIEGLSILVAKESEFSFPSGHASNSLSCAWVLFRMLPKKYGVPALVLAILIALSRLYVGVHYPTDVICGAIIGVVLAELAMWICGRIEGAWKKKKA